MPCHLTSLGRKLYWNLVSWISFSAFDHFLCESFLWYFINRIIQIHVGIRPHLRRLRKVISASQRLSNSRQTPLEMQTKCFSPYSYVCDRLGGSPSLISCTKSFSFIMQVEMAKKSMIYHQVTFMRKTRRYNFALRGLQGWSLGMCVVVYLSCRKASYCLQSPIILAAFHCDLRSSTNTLFGIWCLRVCPVNDAPFVLGCAASTKSDLLREVFVVYAVVDEGRFHPRHRN